MQLTPQAQAVLLLNVSFGKADSSNRPLTKGEWVRFRAWLSDNGLEPSVLLKGDLDKLLYGWEDRTVTRERLRALIFDEPDLKQKLEAIIHPRVRAQIREFADRVDYPYCIICIPLLLETGAQSTVDRVLVVDAPEELQVARVGRRDHADERQTRSIIRSQTGRAERLHAAHDIIVNDGNISDLKTRVENLHDRYMKIGSEKKQ